MNQQTTKRPTLYEETRAYVERTTRKPNGQQGLSESVLDDVTNQVISGLPSSVRKEREAMDRLAVVSVGNEPRVVA